MSDLRISELPTTTDPDAMLVPLSKAGANYSINLKTAMANAELSTATAAALDSRATLDADNLVAIEQLTPHFSRYTSSIVTGAEVPLFTAILSGTSSKIPRMVRINVRYSHGATTYANAYELALSFSASQNVATTIFESGALLGKFVFDYVSGIGLTVAFQRVGDGSGANFTFDIFAHGTSAEYFLAPDALGLVTPADFAVGASQVPYTGATADLDMGTHAVKTPTTDTATGIDAVQKRDGVDKLTHGETETVVHQDFRGTGSGTFGNARIENYISSSDFARFGHKEHNNVTNFGFAQNGLTSDAYVEGENIFLRPNGIEVLKASTGVLEVAADIIATGHITSEIDYLDLNINAPQVLSVPVANTDYPVNVFRALVGADFNDFTFDTGTGRYTYTGPDAKFDGHLTFSATGSTTAMDCELSIYISTDGGSVFNRVTDSIYAFTIDSTSRLGAQDTTADLSTGDIIYVAMRCVNKTGSATFGTLKKALRKVT